MRFYFFVETFPVISETFIENQISYLKDRGYTVSIFSLNKGDSGKASSENKLIQETIFLFNPKGSFLNKFLDLISHFKNNYRKFSWEYFLEKNRFIRLVTHGFFYWYNSFYFNRLKDNDVLHAHFGNIGIVCNNFLTIGVLGKPKFFVSLHGADFKYIKGIGKSDVFFENINALILNSDYSFNLVSKIIPKNFIHKLKILPLGTDTKFFTQVDKIKGNKGICHILYCGRLIRWKGVLFSIEIISSLVKEKNIKNIKFHIIGDGSLKSELIEKINSYGLAEFITLYGALSKAEVRKIMNNSDIFLYPGIKDPETGRQETQGVVLQEAQAMELPVVASNVGGVKDSIIDKETGFLIEELDLDRFVDKLEYLILNENIRKSMGKRGREFVIGNFENDVIWGEKYLQIINE